MKFITFPKDEYSSYLERLNDGKIIYTTRVSDEVGKYRLNHIYSSDFGLLEVVCFEHYFKIDDHPYYDELNEAQLLDINNNIDDRGFDLIGLFRI